MKNCNRPARLLAILALAMGIQPACAEANAAPKPLLSCDEMVYPPIPHAYSKADVNGVTYLYAGGNLHRNFSLSADLTLPKIPTNRALFYADWLMLIPRARSKNLPFVQINLLRWRRFAYRPEVSYTWAAPDGTLIYADSKIFLEDSKVHRFGIAVRGSAIRMSLDGRDICRAKTADFFNFRVPLYFQVGNEVNRYGDRIAGTASNIRLKTDDDRFEKPYVSTCMSRDRGLYWQQVGAGTFSGRGVLTRGAPSFFTGISPGSPCQILIW